MQHESLSTKTRLEGPDVSEFRWSEKGPYGKLVYRKRVIGTSDQYPAVEVARAAVAGLIAEVNWSNIRADSIAMTVAQLSSHFEQRELARSNTWRSYSAKKCYSVYLHGWIVPYWAHYELRHVRTIEVEAWLRRLPLARSSCAKIRNLMSVLFNHACRSELFDRNPIRLVRQRAKRKAVPNVLTPSEIKLLVNTLDVREKTLVLLAPRRIYGITSKRDVRSQMRDIDIEQKTITVTRSIVDGVVGQCKTELSQKPVSAHPLLLDALVCLETRATL